MTKTLILCFSHIYEWDATGITGCSTWSYLLHRKAAVAFKLPICCKLTLERLL